MTVSCAKSPWSDGLSPPKHLHLFSGSQAAIFVHVSLRGHPTEDVRILFFRKQFPPVINPDVCSRHGPNIPSGDESLMPSSGLDGQKIRGSCPRSETLLVLRGLCSSRVSGLGPPVWTQGGFHQSPDQRPGAPPLPGALGKGSRPRKELWSDAGRALRVE